jgi:LacI family transcriptional regulator
MHERVILNLMYRRDQPIEIKISEGFSEAAAKRGYAVMNGLVPFDPREEVRRLVANLGDRVCALAIQPYRPNRELAELLLTSPIHNLPHILIGHYFKDIRVNACVIDNYGGMYAMTEHLIMMGRRHPCFLGEINAGSTEDERFLGFCFACLHKGVQVPPISMANMSDLGLVVRTLLENDPSPDALVCAGDFLAREAMEIVSGLGLRIPEDCAVTSFGDDVDVADLCNPPLSTVYHPAREMGAVAAHQLINQIEGRIPSKPSVFVLPVSLHLRKSCGSSFSQMREGVFREVPFSNYVGVKTVLEDCE